MLFREIAIFLVAVSYYGPICSYSNNTVPKYYCGSSLSGALFSVCRKNGFVTHFSPRAKFNRSPRGIIGECCINPCSEDQLSQYCQKKIARISIPMKRKRSQKFVVTNKISKSKRSPPSTCSCGNRIQPRRSTKKSRENRKRSTKARQKKSQLVRPSSIGQTNVVTSTTESQVVAEAQYIDDWTWSGNEEGLFSVKSR